MSLPEGEKAACGNCFSACCKAGIQIAMTRREAAFLERGGTVLDVLYGERDDTTYQFRSNCGYLRRDAETGRPKCGVYGSADRPEACGNFEMGGTECIFVRELQGVEYENRRRREYAGE